MITPEQRIWLENRAMHPWCQETWIPAEYQKYLYQNEPTCAGYTNETGIYVLTKTNIVFIEIPDLEMIPLDSEKNNNTIYAELTDPKVA